MRSVVRKRQSGNNNKSPSQQILQSGLTSTAAAFPKNQLVSYSLTHPTLMRTVSINQPGRFPSAALNNFTGKELFDRNRALLLFIDCRLCPPVQVDIDAAANMKPTFILNAAQAELFVIHWLVDWILQFKSRCLWRSKFSGGNHGNGNTAEIKSNGKQYS